VLRTVTADGLREAVDSYVLAQDDLVEARNRLARAIAGAAMSGMTQAEIVEMTGYPADLVLRICRGAGVSET
jgi:NADH:ubiquinone oxidoreductase subunit F (NADH-binding)